MNSEGLNARYIAHLIWALNNEKNKYDDKD